jgi:hypothetical protein
MVAVGLDLGEPERSEFKCIPRWRHFRKVR